MTKRELAAGALLLLALGVVAGAIRTLDMLGADTLRLLALILAVPAGVAVMAIGLTPLVRAWRVPAVTPPERQVIREVKLHTHTIDGRRAPEPLPSARPLDLYPALQSPEWRANLRLPDGRDETGMARSAWRAEPPGAEVSGAAWEEWEPYEPGSG